MMLLRALLPVALVACTASLCAADWPCPDPNAIKPCTCTTDANFKLYMDCSDVPSSDALTKIFQTHFAFNDFQSLTIKPTNASQSLEDLPGDVFGPVTFEAVEITGTRIQTVDSETFALSNDTLTTLRLSNNKINSFPYETLSIYTKLVELDISHNSLSGVCSDIVSNSLITLDMSVNEGLKLIESTFQGVPGIEQLHLNGMKLKNSTPPNVFKPLKYIVNLSLENNEITHLIENLINPEEWTLMTLSLNNNKITQIHPVAVTGIKDKGTVELRNNAIEYLHRDNWEALISQLQPNAIDLRNNPLVCGCDVMWLVFEPILMTTIHSETTCSQGIKLVDLPKDWFLQHCPLPHTSHAHL